MSNSIKGFLEVNIQNQKQNYQVKLNVSKTKLNVSAIILGLDSVLFFMVRDLNCLWEFVLKLIIDLMLSLFFCKLWSSAILILTDLNL